jgi:hypothetical protein
MPARPAYFHRLAHAIDIFRRLHSEWIDRRALEETLGVSKTVAWRILRRCGAEAGSGNTLICRRETLIAALTRLEQTGECEREVHRRERLDTRLSDLLAAASSRHVQLLPADCGLELRNTRFARLPAGVELTRDRLVIEFAGTPDFLQKVGALVFALQNDYEAVNEFLG